MLKSIEEERRMLAIYLCEDPSRLALQEVFSTLQKFRELFIKACKVRSDGQLNTRRDYSQSER